MQWCMTSAHRASPLSKIGHAAQGNAILLGTTSRAGIEMRWTAVDASLRVCNRAETRRIQGGHNESEIERSDSAALKTQEETEDNRCSGSRVECGPRKAG